jgi:hypothetical protein
MTIQIMAIEMEESMLKKTIIITLAIATTIAIGIVST